MIAGQKDKRKHTRYVPQPKAFAVFRPDFNHVGHIMDISKRGLSFQYMAAAQPEYDWTQLDIFFTDKGFYMHQVPCRVVYNRRVDGRQTNENGLSTFRCGVELGDLTQSQLRQLDMFLMDHVAGHA